jgi:chemotaxis protein histidine kinase CheA
MGKASIRHTTSAPNKASSPDFEAILDRLKGEFVEYAKDTIVELDNLIKAGQGQDGAHEQIINAMRRSVHDLKGTGDSFGFPLITLLAYRMESIFVGKQDLDRIFLTDAQCFVDHLRWALEGRFDGVSEADIIQTLPARSKFVGAETVK